MKNYDEIIERHSGFWERAEGLRRPLLIFSHGWIDGPKLMRAMGDVSGPLKPGDVDAGKFLNIHREIIAEAEMVDDDSIAMAEPLVSVPWMEAYHGCAPARVGEYIWAEKVFSDFSGADAVIEKGPDEGWLDQYLAYQKRLSAEFSGECAVSQPILRGVADVACAMAGEENVIFGMIDHEDAAHRLFAYISDTGENFFRRHMEGMPRFKGGYVVGQYHIWTPGMCLRVQDDAMAVFSPKLYEDFVLSHTERMVKLTKYNVVHLHLTSAHILDKICALDAVRAIEYDIDEGSERVENHIGTFKKIQSRGKNLIIKARFSKAGVEAVKELAYAGLCVIPVVDTKEEAIGILKEF